MWEDESHLTGNCATLLLIFTRALWCSSSSLLLSSELLAEELLDLLLPSGEDSFLEHLSLALAGWGPCAPGLDSSSEGPTDTEKEQHIC